jgi:hypothetical protein
MSQIPGKWAIYENNSPIGSALGSQNEIESVPPDGKANAIQNSIDRNRSARGSEPGKIICFGHGPGAPFIFIVRFFVHCPSWAGHRVPQKSLDH